MTCSRVGSRYPIRTGMGGSSCCLDSRRAGHRKWDPSFTQSESGQEGQQLLNLGHVVHLTAAFERVHPLFRGDYRVPVKIGGALLELREILDRFQRALRAEQALDVDAAQ